MQSIVHSSLSKALVINNIVHTNRVVYRIFDPIRIDDTYRVSDQMYRDTYRIIQTIHNPISYGQLGLGAGVGLGQLGLEIGLGLRFRVMLGLGLWRVCAVGDN